jgi:hypothetical protein
MAELREQMQHSDLYCSFRSVGPRVEDLHPHTKRLLARLQASDNVQHLKNPYCAGGGNLNTGNA